MAKKSFFTKLFLCVLLLALANPLMAQRKINPAFTQTRKVTPTYAQPRMEMLKQKEEEQAAAKSEAEAKAAKEAESATAETTKTTETTTSTATTTTVTPATTAATTTTTTTKPVTTTTTPSTTTQTTNTTTSTTTTAITTAPAPTTTASPQLPSQNEAQKVPQTVVQIKVPGTLSSSLKNTESELKIIGKINGTDIKYLRDLINSGTVTSLDFSETEFVSGGLSYYSKDGTDYKSADDTISDFSFCDCTNLKKVILPTSVKSIGRQAFCKTGLSQVEIPDNITLLGYDSFGACKSLESVVIGSGVKTMNQGVFWNCGKVKKAFVKAPIPPQLAAYIFSAKPTIYVYTETLKDYQKSDWPKFGTIAGGVEQFYPAPSDSILVLRPKMKSYFSDDACTTLNFEYKNMSDDMLKRKMADDKIPDSLINVTLKVKNNRWAEYEKDFRIHSYKAYSDASSWNTKLKAWNGSYMGNPTGIYCAEEGQPLYVFVGSEVPDDATLYFEGCTENNLIHGKTKGTLLSKGLNIIEGKKDALYYVLYTADTSSMTKAVSEWPAIKIHVEGGIVNGYYDISRHTENDYAKILGKATHELFTVKGENSLFNFKTSTYRQYWPKEIEKSIRWYDSLLVRELEVIGISESVASGKCSGAPLYLTGGESFFPKYYNNPAFAIEGSPTDGGYANASNYRTSYNSTACCSKSFDPTRSDFDDWCAAHECGHLNQGPINLEGCTEVSNNLFSNIIRFSDGFQTTSGSEVSVTVNDYVNHTPYFTRDIWSMTRMYYQLYLYYHLAQNNTSFYPSLFKAFREDPMTMWDANKSSLKFVRKVCEVAQEDLTDFFRFWGFFEPCTNLSVGGKTLTVKQSDIDATLNEISKYPKKNRGIIFIEDRVEKVPSTDYIMQAGNTRLKAGNPGQYGDLGQFTDYIAKNRTKSNYTFTQTDSKITMKGTGGVGFIVQDVSGKIIFASNSLNFSLPKNTGALFKIYSVDADGTLHECRKS